MAPEQNMGEYGDAFTSIRALEINLYELLTKNV